MASDPTTAPTLTTVTAGDGFDFQAPIKRINDGDDVTFFLQSKAYADIMTFIFQLNTAMIPRKVDPVVREWQLDEPDFPLPDIVRNIAKLLQNLTSVINEAPPDPGPRRFGNISFRKWYDLVRERTPDLLAQHLPGSILSFRSTSSTCAQDELSAYFLGSFGSSQRLDYGTGHELSFLAFLACLYKLGAFSPSADKHQDDGSTERALVIGIIQPYLILIRKLILTYTLEPAGSHGVWGLDDHSFLPYIFGSAQYCPPITSPLDIVAEGSLPTSPNPGAVANPSSVTRLRNSNMYFSAIGFILDVKKGPFWEHSPILYDISGVQKGWAKINKGMIKMYNAEVLSKFPVVQHFPFGGLFKWDEDPNAQQIAASVHTSSQPKSRDKGETVPSATSSTSAYASPRPGPPTASRDSFTEPSVRSSAGGRAQAPLRNPMVDAPGGVGSAAPWVTSSASQPPLRNPMAGVGTVAPWATSANAQPPFRNPMAGVGTAAPWATASRPQLPSGPNQPMRAPRAARTSAPPLTPPPPASSSEAGTKAPWANKKP